MATIFNALEEQIIKHGTVNESSTDLSELSLIGEGEERVIGFSLLGSPFLLTVEGEVLSVEENEDNADEPSIYALVDEMKKSVYGFLKWRYDFFERFNV